ncbi:hypothetical protein [Kangiella sediminilitoris]|uniref:Uncharacterized protein n=1 Tax=Kangiella sediminilitoris TaxID=1144748 RepID=A0A1B3BCP1_9GAMM|nr:hypothetical protein [Kangiella sediminilitoris]AOE50580.1 hypothetical protein KS2013_1871 [Kangiella sediminilitoris]
MKHVVLVLCIFIISCKTTNVQNNSEPKPEAGVDLTMFYTPQELTKIEFIESTGRLIWIKDSLAWQATDILLEAIDPAQLKNSKGWVVHLNKPESPTVTFYQELNQKLDVIADVVFDKNFQNPNLILAPERTVTKREYNMVTALNTVRSSLKTACSPTVNSVVLPMENGWQVYILTATKEPGVIPIGGHKQYITSPDGKTILSEEAYSKSCIKLQEPKDPTIAMGLTHIVDDFPAPTHVFHNLQTGFIFYIKTEKGIWKIVEGEITLLQDT